MARSRQSPNPNDAAWAQAERAFQAGSPEFVELVRGVADAKRLATFAETWYTDTRIEARRLLNLYLDRPLNALRHEPLVKRLFKFADNAGDDATVARFMVAFDRTIRRNRSTRQEWNTSRRNWDEKPSIATPRDTALPRDDRLIVSDMFLKNREKYTDGRFLFSVVTRNYLRRRAWRYFRKLGRKFPDRYLPAVCLALKLYTDADMPDGLALLDNWGLVHALFHHSPTIESRPAGWRLAKGGSLARLQPDPMFRKLWLRSPEPAFDLLTNARSCPVRLWAVQVLKRHFPERLKQFTVDELLAWLEAPIAELNELALELLQTVPGLDRVPVERWVKLTETTAPGLLDQLCPLIARLVKPEQVSFADSVRLAMARPIPLAMLGMKWLEPKRPRTPDEVRTVFNLRDAEAEPLRPGLVRWACGVLGEQPDFQPAWVLEFLDSRHEDVREVGWEWLQTEARAREDVMVWQRLLESPYDQLRVRLVTMLEERAKERGGLEACSPGLVRFLWASVLLNIHRGGRAKPFVVRQIIERLGRKPDEAAELLPIVAVALRSTRGPEFRVGLAGLAGFVARHPQHRGIIETRFPELQLT